MTLFYKPLLLAEPMFYLVWSLNNLLRDQVTQKPYMGPPGGRHLKYRTHGQEESIMTVLENIILFMFFLDHGKFLCSELLS